MSVIGPDFQEVVDRLKAALHVKTNKQVAEALGMTAGNLAEKKTRNALPMEQIEAACEQARINREWLLFGRGEMRKGSQEANRRIGLLKETQAAVKALTLHDEDARLLHELLFFVQIGDRDKVLERTRRLGVVAVPRFAIAASAGNGTEVSVADGESVVDMMAFRPEWLSSIGITHRSVAVISVRGDSMADTLQDGDLILVDTSLVDRKVSGVYVIAREDRLMVKRLHFKTNGGVEVRSDNKAYPTETLTEFDFERLHIVGRMARRVVR